MNRKNTEKLYKFCVECGQVLGPRAVRCCSDKKFLAIEGSRIRPETVFYDLAGNPIEEPELSGRCTAAANQSRAEQAQVEEKEMDLSKITSAMQRLDAPKTKPKRHRMTILVSAVSIGVFVGVLHGFWVGAQAGNREAMILGMAIGAFLGLVAGLILAFRDMFFRR